MKNKIISIIIGAIVVVGVGTVVYTQKQSTTLPAENNLSQTPVNEQNQPSSVPTGNTTVESNTQGVIMLPLEDGYEDEEDDNAGTVVTTPTNPPVKPTQPSGITLAQVAEHSSRTNCWSAVNGNVYDLTSWIPNHPGGEARILSMCGVDGSSGYNRQHGGKSKPATILAGFKVGVLSK